MQLDKSSYAQLKEVANALGDIEPLVKTPESQTLVSDRTVDKLSSLSPQTASFLPYTSIWAATNPDPRMAKALDSSVGWMKTLYGDSTAARIQLALAPPAQRAILEAQLIFSGAFGGNPGVGFTTQFLQNVGSQDLPQATKQRFERLVNRVAEGKPLSELLSDEQRSGLDQLIKSTTDNAAENVPLIGSVVDAALKNNYVSIDPEWAKAHPVWALAAYNYVQEKSPGLEVRIGDKGFVDSVGQALGTSVDIFTAPVSVAARGYSELAHEVSNAISGPGLSDTEYIKVKTQLRQELNKGENADEEKIKQYEQVLRFQERNEASLATPSEAWHDALNPTIAGNGIGESVMRGSGYSPMDPEFIVGSSIISFAAGVWLDPVTIFANVSKGAKLASKLLVPADIASDAKRAAEYASNLTKSRIAQRTFLANMRTADDWFGSPMAARSAESTFDWLKSMPADRRIVSLTDRGLDLGTAKAIAAAPNSASVLAAQHVAVLGGAIDSTPVLAAAGRLEKAQRSLGRLTELHTSQLDADLNPARAAARPKQELVQELTDVIDSHTTPGARGMAQVWDKDLQALHQSQFEAFKVSGAAREVSPGVWQHPVEARGETTLWHVNENGVVDGYRTFDADGAQTIVDAAAQGNGIGSQLLRQHWEGQGIWGDPSRMLEEVGKGNFSEAGAALNKKMVNEALSDYRGPFSAADRVELDTLESQYDNLRVEREFNQRVMDLSTSRAPLSSTGRVPAKAPPEVMRDFFTKPPSGPLEKTLHYIFTGGPEAGGLDKTRRVVRKLWQKFPAGEIVNPARLPAGALSDSVDKSIAVMKDYMRALRVPEGSIGRIVDDYAKIGDDPYKFSRIMRNMSDTIAEESPILDPYTKRMIQNLGGDTQVGVSDTLKGRVWDELPDGTRVGGHTATVSNPGGAATPAAVWPSEWQDSWRLPSKDFILELTGFYRRQLRSMAGHGAVSRFTADKLRALLRGSDTLTSWWKQAVLLGKLPVSLPLRIEGEQTLVRMPGYGFSGALHNRADYLASVRSTGRYADVPEVPPQALGGIAGDLFPAGKTEEMHLATFSTNKQGQVYGDWALRQGGPPASPGAQMYADRALVRTQDPVAQAILSGPKVESLDLMDIVQNADGTTTIRGWHAPRAGAGVPAPGTDLGFGGFHFGTKEAADSRFAETAIYGSGQPIPIETTGRFLGVDAPLSEADNAILAAGSFEEASISGLLDGFIDEGAIDAPLDYGDILPEHVQGLSPTMEQLIQEVGPAGDLRAALKAKGYDGIIYTNEVEHPGSLSAMTFDTGNIRLETQDSALEWLRANPSIYKGWKNEVARTGMSEEAVLARMRKEIDQLAGEGEKAADMRTALRSGVYVDADEAIQNQTNAILKLKGTEKYRKASDSVRVELEAEAAAGAIAKAGVKVGSDEFAQLTQHLVENGKWIPPIEVSNPFKSVRVGAAESKATLRERLFKRFLQDPDIHLSRNPLYSQMYVRKYDELIAMGVSPALAKARSQASAARGASNALYDLSERSVFQQKTRNIFPFGAAWEELATTYAAKIPGQYGQGIGQLLELEQMRRVEALLRGTGITQTNPLTGETSVTVPGLDQFLSAISGGKLHATFNLKALNIVTAGLPGLGPIPSSILGTLSKQYDNKLIDGLSSVFMSYGLETTLAPTTMNSLWVAATGKAPPWEVFSSDYQQLLLDFAVEDGVRIARAQAGKPPTDKKAFDAWQADILEKGRNIARMQYLLRGLSSSFAPAVIHVEDDYEKELAGIWKELSLYPDGSAASTQMLNGFIADYPGASWYLTGKTINKGAERSYEDFTDFLQAWRNKQIKVLSPEEFTSLAAGMEFERYIWHERDDAIRQMGGTAPDILSNRSAYLETYQHAQDQIDAFRALNPDFARIFDEKFPDKAQGEGFMQAQRVSDAFSSLTAVSDLMETPEGYTTEAYRKARGQLIEQMDEIGAFADPSAPKNQWQADLAWYTTNVQVPYWDQRDAIFADMQKNALSKADQGPYWEKIRQLANAQEAQTRNGQTYPTPEEVSWASMEPKDQELVKNQWGLKPVEWLTDFQMETLGYPVGSNGSEFITTINSWDSQFEAQAKAEGISSSSSIYQQARAELDQQELAKAEDLGTTDLFGLVKAAPYQRLQASGGQWTNPTFTQLSTAIDSIRSQFEAEDVSINGSTPQAVAARAWLVQSITALRDRDPVFDGLMNQLQVASGDEPENPLPPVDTYLQVFFDYFGPSQSVQTGAA